MIKDKTLWWSLSNEPNQMTDNKMLCMHSAAEKLMRLGFKISLGFVVVDANGVTLSEHVNRITVAAKKYFPGAM